MSRLAQLGRQLTGKRAAAPRPGLACAAAGALALVLSLAPAAYAQSNSGIFINNDVLNSLGPSPDTAPLAPMPMAPAAPAAPTAPTAPAAPGVQAGATPGTGSAVNGLSFQTQGSGNYVVTRPGTLLFPPLHAPTSTLAPAFAHNGDGAKGDTKRKNDAARKKALDNAFASGPEPTSQLLIPLDGNSDVLVNDSITIYEDQLPPPSAPGDAASQGPRIVLHMPAPPPAARKPSVPPKALAEIRKETRETQTALAPEFRTPKAPKATAPALAPTVAPQAVAPQAVAKVPAPAPAAKPAAPKAPKPAMAKAAEPAAPAPAPQVAAKPAGAPVSSADMPAPQPMTAPAPTPGVATAPLPQAAPQSARQGAGKGPVSLLPENTGGATAAAAPAQAPQSGAGGSTASSGLQTASLTVGSGDARVENLSVAFEPESAELSDHVQAELRSLADTIRTHDQGRIQVLGFASADGSSQDLARQLALSRALKVRTFLIDAGVPSGRIQVRSLGSKSGGGPANRVDIRPIDS